MLEFLSDAVDAVESAVGTAVQAVVGAPPPAAVPPRPTSTVAQQSWLASVLGVAPPADAAADEAAQPSSAGASAGSGGAADTGAGGAGPGETVATEEGDGWFDDVLHVAGMGKRAGREETVEAAVTRLRGMKEDDIQALGTDERLQLLHQLQANGDPAGQARGMEKRLYANTPIDPAQQAVDDARSDAIARAVAADPKLQAAQANWASLSEADKVAALRTIVAAQSAAMGIAAPEIVVENGMTAGGMTVSGTYRDADGTLRLNMGGDSMTANFPQAVSIATHENTHHYQTELLKRLHDGALKPGDAEYDQARLFEANNAPGGYIEPGEGNPRTEEEQRNSVETYKSQPVERHAWGNGSTTAVKIDRALKSARGVGDFQAGP